MAKELTSPGAVAEETTDTVAVPKKQNTDPAKKSAEKNPGGFCVYLGPTILGVIQHGAVIGDNDEYAQAMKEAALKSYPLVASLLIPKGRLAADRANVKTPGTALYEAYRQLAAALKTK